MINLDNPKYLVPISLILFLYNNNVKLFNLINLDNPNPKYLVPILFLYKYKVKLFNLINLDNPNPKYLVPISPILFYIYMINININNLI